MKERGHLSLWILRERRRVKEKKKNEEMICYSLG